MYLNCCQKYKKEKEQKSMLKGKDILNAWSIYLLILLLIILTSPLFPGLRSTLENNWVTRISLPINDSSVNYTIAWLTHAGVLLFVGTFVGGLIQGAKVKELFVVLWNTVKQLKKTFVTVICLVGLSTRHDFRDSHCTRHSHRKPLPSLCSGYRLSGYLHHRK